MGFWFLLLWVFTLGTIVGSFLNCLVYRLKENKSFARGRSFCPKCKHILSWPDLIPILSFVWLGGRCRYCGQKISFQYPIVEIITGLLFVVAANYELRLPAITLAQAGITNYEFSALNWPVTIKLFSLWFISSCLIAIFIYDLKHYLIPDQVLYPAIAATFLYKTLAVLDCGNLNFGCVSDFGFRISDFHPLQQALLAGVGASLFFLLIWFVSRGQWMGFGDVKLALLMGLFLGWPSIVVALFSAFLIGAVAGIILLILGLKKMKSEVHFGPFLITGTFIGLFWGQQIVSWYLSMFIY